MRVSRRNTSLLLSLLLILFTTTIIVRADDDEPDEYDVTARVVRTSLIDGQVDLKRNGNQDWEHIRLNYPLVEGDTVMTCTNSRLEIQVDSRNFVRLAPGSILRIVTLRDEGVALSVVEGSVSVRLAKFDRKKEYFELDAPNTTLAAEKTGLYRVDVPREGRVRVTVRDGGTARIYSDTSGFTLRDGRSAELVISGETAGDWEFEGAAARDDVDNWVDDRERYLAQRLRYDTKYFDEYVWGAEDLDAYGDWSYTNDFGWIWQPRRVVLAGYTDWAPYRYGHWTWCPPYGWTWVGYEPWGWAPYHYGRWVFYNNYWAWVPRSRFYRHRSWWRPALVAFVFNINFGNDICWYPLSYYHRDPYARNYRHYERRPGYGGGGGAGGGGHDRPRPRYDNPNDKTWRGVTRVPRRDFGNPDRNGRPVDDERIARRVIDIDPQRSGDLPRGGAVVGNTPRRNPEIDIPERRTGAGDRTPGTSMDDDLRRSRVFRGREPRIPDPNTTPTNTSETNTPNTTPETRPTGVIVRPETPRDDSPGRVVKPTMPDGVEKRERNRVGIETPQPRVDPERRSEPPRSEPPREEPRREEPRREEPRREEPRPEEPRREEPRREEPRSQPKSETPREPTSAPRETPKAAPRWEAPPRSEPRSEPKSEPRSEPSRPSSPPPRNDPPPKSETPRSEPRSEPRDNPKKPDNE